MEFSQFEDITYSEPQVQPNTEAELIRINVPSGQTFVLSHFANYVGDALAWNNVNWTVIVDGVPFRNFYKFTDQIGAVNLPREIPFGHIIARRDFVVLCENANTDATGSVYAIGASIKGAYIRN
jgi:hypothetical protein